MTMKNKILKEDNFFRTVDLSLASTIFMFYPLEAVDKQNPRRAEFVFEHSQELDVLIESFWRRELKVDPRAYFDALRSIKARLYDR
jgi:hypothetical protein